MDPTLARPTLRTVHKALHRELTLAGVDRRVFFLALLMGAATFNLVHSFAAGLLVAGGLYGGGLWTTRHDPKFLRILLSSSRLRRCYDPGKYTAVDVDVVAA